MSHVEPVTANVFYAPTARRRYFTKRAAIRAEARAMIEQKYSTEPQEYDGGNLVHSGWHWTQDERLTRLHQRVCRFLGRKSEAKEGESKWG